MSTRSWLVAFVLVVILGFGGYYLWQGRGSAPSAGNVTTVEYSCAEGKTIDAMFVQGGALPPVGQGQPPQPAGSVSLNLSDGRSLTVPQTISADGARYANADESFIFWSKGNGAFILENNNQTYMGCVAVALNPGGLPGVFASGQEGFSLRYPASYRVTEGYTYQEMGPGHDIGGVKFTIPTTTAEGTNLGSDTYFSVEEIPNAATTCDASLFLEPQAGSLAPQTITDNGTTYSLASTTGAGAGNRYEELVYAIPGANPCTAVRYFIHYSVIENYPPGAVEQFDEQALLSQFDSMRHTLTLL